MNTAAQTNAFTLDKINVAYDENPVLIDITLNIQHGEKVAIIGKSGSGKTTLLRKLFELNSDCSFIHQNFALVPQLSVFHNVYSGRLDKSSTLTNLRNLILPSKQKKEEILPFIEQVGLAEKAFAKVGHLSGGQQQRVALARALYQGGSILLGDEPVSSLDPHQADSIIESIISTPKTVILSMHSVELALKYADRIIALNCGKVSFDLPSKEVTEDHLKELYKPC